MKSFIIFTVLFTITTFCYSQELDSATHIILNDSALTLKKKIYIIDINKGGLNPSFGYLQSINSNTLSITSSPLQYGTSREGRLVSYNNIDKIRIHRRGNVGRGALIGAVIGIVAGGVIGAISYSKPTPSAQSGWFSGLTFDFGVGFSIVAGSLGGLLLGLPTGALFGSHVNEYAIDKNKQAFEDMRNHLSDDWGSKIKYAPQHINQ